jgi:DNA uptake protein ComE-like DNA-binding protein
MRLVVALVIAGGVVAQAQSRSQGREDFTQYLPPGDGKALVSAQCASCHELKGTIQLRKSKQEWEAIVFDMVARGAPLTVEEADAIVAYLSTAFGPSAPPLVDVNTAAKVDLVKLPGVTPDRADRLLAHRAAKGPLPSRDDVRGVLGLDEAAFTKMKWYLKVSH